MHTKTSYEKRRFVVAESLSNFLLQQTRQYIPPEELYSWIDCYLSLTDDEQEEEAEQIEKLLAENKKQQARTKSTFDELRELLGMKELSLLGTVKAATEEIKRLREK